VAAVSWAGGGRHKRDWGEESGSGLGSPSRVCPVGCLPIRCGGVGLDTSGRASGGAGQRKWATVPPYDQ
jgi:hypothetical protein